MSESTLQPQPQPHPHSLGGKIAGMLVFLIGVALLLLVFYLAYTFFTGLAHAISHPNPAKAPSLLTVLARGVLQLGMLFVMGYIGSLIASKGLELFGVSRGVSAK